MTLPDIKLSEGAREAVRIHEFMQGGAWHTTIIPREAIGRAVQSGLLRSDGCQFVVDEDVAQVNIATRDLDWS